MRGMLACTALITFSVNIATTDIVVLRNGDRVEGTAQHPNDIRTKTQHQNVVSIEVDGKLMTFDSDQIDYVVLGDSEETGERIDFVQSEFAPPPPGSTGEGSSWYECHAIGSRDGSEISTGGSFAGGFVGGLFLGLIGTGIAVLAQSEPTPAEASLMNLEEGECRYAYTEAFKSKGRGKKRTSALTGGLIGTAIITIVIVAAASSSSSS